MHKLLGATVGLALVLGLTTVAAAQSPRLTVDEDTWLQLRFIAQLQVEAVENAAGIAGDKWSTDFFTRRARIMGSGSVHSKVKFFFSTDVPNTGKYGVTNEVVWNDGFIDFQFGPQFKLAMGRILVPFSPENRASAGSLLGIDYNLNLLKTPTPVNRAFWRDEGFEARGVLADGLFEYRGGIFKGERTYNLGTPADPLLNNPDNALRSTGMAMVNLGDAQPGLFYNPNSLGALEVLSFGAGFDRIPNSTSGIDHSMAWNVFALVEKPFADGLLNVMAAYYNWEGPAWAGGFEGTTMGVQVGYLMPTRMLDGQWQPVLRLQQQDNPDADFTLNTINLGLNYYLKGHAINCKLDFALNDRQIGGENVNALRFQTQLLF
jgi:hypothetical protein